MDALRWKRSPVIAARGGGGVHDPNVSSTSVSSAGGSTTNITNPISSDVMRLDTATQPTHMQPIDAANNAAQRPKVCNVKLKLEIDTTNVADQSTAPTCSPGCFPFSGWTRSTSTKSSVKPIAVKSAEIDGGSSTVLPPISPVGGGPHCYAGRMSPFNGNSSPPPRRSPAKLRYISASFRRQVLCSHCKAFAAAATSPSKILIHDDAKHQQQSTLTDSSHCWICSKVKAYETQLAKSFFCPDQVDGKCVSYPGLPPECYRKWFIERPLSPPESVRKTQAKRTEMMNTLQRQHKLHYHKLQDICTEIGSAFSTATCFISVADTNVELIVGNYGSMLKFSCFPRDIGMCDYTMGSTEQHLLVNDVPEDPAFRENPMLQAVKANFYFGVPICVNDLAIGAIAVVDPQPRTGLPDPIAIQLMQQHAYAMGARVAALLSTPTVSIVSRIMKRR